jgi:hypothetical protein
MRNLVLVAAACALSGGLFWLLSLQRAEAGANLDPFLEEASAALVAAVASGAESERSALTLVVGGSIEGESPLHLARRPKGIWGRILAKRVKRQFVFELSEAGFPVGWNPAVRPDPEDSELVEPFARILVKAAEAGVPVRILVHGDAAPFVVAAAERASESTGKPAVSKLVAVGVRLADIKAKDPKKRGEETLRSGKVVADWNLLWIDPKSVPSSLAVHGPDGVFERDPAGFGWKSLVLTAFERGPEALRPRKVPEPARRPRPRDRIRQKPKSGLDMLGKSATASKENPQYPRAGVPSGSRFYPLGDTGWFVTKDRLAEFPVQYMGDELVIVRENARVRLYTGRNGTRAVCGRAGIEIQRAVWNGYPVEKCYEVPSREPDLADGFQEYWTVIDGDTLITVSYRYPTGMRNVYVYLIQEVIGALTDRKY